MKQRTSLEQVTYSHPGYIRHFHAISTCFVTVLSRFRHGSFALQEFESSWKRVSNCNEAKQSVTLGQSPADSRMRSRALETCDIHLPASLPTDTCLTSSETEPFKQACVIDVMAGLLTLPSLAGRDVSNMTCASLAGVMSKCSVTNEELRLPRFCRE